MYIYMVFCLTILFVFYFVFFGQLLLTFVQVPILKKKNFYY